MVENNNGTRSLLLTVRPSLGRNIARYYTFFFEANEIEDAAKKRAILLGESDL